MIGLEETAHECWIGDGYLGLAGGTIDMNTFGESERLKALFSREARGSFSIVYRALVLCREANGEILREHDVVEKIRSLRAEASS